MTLLVADLSADPISVHLKWSLTQTRLLLACSMENIYTCYYTTGNTKP